MHQKRPRNLVSLPVRCHYTILAQERSKPGGGCTTLLDSPATPARHAFQLRRHVVHVFGLGSSGGVCPLHDWVCFSRKVYMFLPNRLHNSEHTHTLSRNECVLSKCPKSLQSHSFLCFFTSFVAKAVQLIETGLTTAGILPPPPEDETCVQASLPAVQRRDALVKSEEVSLLHLPPSERFRCCCRFTRYNSVVRFVSASVPLAGLLRSHFWCSTRRWLGCNLLCDPLLSNSAIAWLARSGSMPP